jgi:hypothetical protein
MTEGERAARETLDRLVAEFGVDWVLKQIDALTKPRKSAGRGRGRPKIDDRACMAEMERLLGADAKLGLLEAARRVLAAYPGLGSGTIDNQAQRLVRKFENVLTFDDPARGLDRARWAKKTQN